VSFQGLAEMMVDHDLVLAERERQATTYAAAPVTSKLGR